MAFGQAAIGPVQMPRSDIHIALRMLDFEKPFPTSPWKINNLIWPPVRHQGACAVAKLTTTLQREVPLVSVTHSTVPVGMGRTRDRRTQRFDIIGLCRTILHRLEENQPLDADSGSGGRWFESTHLSGRAPPISQEGHCSPVGKRVGNSVGIPISCFVPVPAANDTQARDPARCLRRWHYAGPAGRVEVGLLGVLADIHQLRPPSCASVTPSWRANMLSMARVQHR
jgi:hypothetical protein